MSAGDNIKRWICVFSEGFKKILPVGGTKANKNFHGKVKKCMM